ncbi:uncharacterized protein LOC111016442 [Momordica charantia]|uniref:Uncharacterized protein LOC111016442 n=1 Tax=Momordica charantia TaxID=3673 RepID=A0A6J1D2M1_MOMCH|nr:uncharacterized protein LOC111016442 [Momordica charantia]
MLLLWAKRMMLLEIALSLRITMGQLIDFEVGTIKEANSGTIEVEFSANCVANLVILLQSATFILIQEFKDLLPLVLVLILLSTKRPISPQMSALLTTLHLNHDTNWYPDLGATNHLTHNFNNLVVGTEYLDSNQVQVGNGACFDIFHFGHSSFQSPTNRILHLNNLLHVPQITKNLISVSQFAKDNSIFF